MIDLEELKKDHRTSYLASVLERLLRQEAQVREMLAGDDALHELAGSELKSIQEQKEGIEKEMNRLTKLCWKFEPEQEGTKPRSLLGNLLICMKGLQK